MAINVKSIAKWSAEARREEKAARYHDIGGKGEAGLYLQISRSGATSWIYRFQLNGAQRDMGLGAYPYVDLEKARDLAKAAKLMLRRDRQDPVEARKAERAAKALEAAKAMNFETAAQQYYDGHHAEWSNDHYRKKFLSSLKMYAFPKIGALAVKDIDTPLVLKVIEPIWLTKPDTANRVRGRIEAILGWCTVRGYREGDNPARWVRHLEEALPAKVRATKHHDALPYSDVPNFVTELNKLPGVPPRALEFLILTAARSSEAIGARWAEIDLSVCPKSS